MIDNLNLFTTWLFKALTEIWNFSINNQLLVWIIAIYIIALIYDHLRKYAGK